MKAKEKNLEHLVPAHNVYDQDVLWPDCDPAGILFYAHYFRWMDNAAQYLFEKAGLNWDVMMGEYGAPGVPLVSCKADFRSTAKFGDVLTIESHIAALSKSTITVSHVFRHHDRVTAEGQEIRVWCEAEPGHPDHLRARPIPLEVRNALGFAE